MRRRSIWCEEAWRRKEWTPCHQYDGNALWVSQRRTSHWKKYPINRVTWYIFIWLCMLDSRRRYHHHDTWKETAAGKRRRAERRFKQEQRYGQEIREEIDA